MFPILECNMASFEDDGARVIDKFNGENFNLGKFKLEMGLGFIDPWSIVEESEAPPPSNVDPKAKKEYEKGVKKTMSIIVLKLADNQLARIRSCKGSAEA